MKIIIKAENKKEQKALGAKEISYKGVTDYYLDVRWIEGKLLIKEESRSLGDLLYLIGKLSSALFQLKETFRNGSSK